MQRGWLTEIFSFKIDLKSVSQTIFTPIKLWTNSKLFAPLEVSSLYAFLWHLNLTIDQTSCIFTNIIDIARFVYIVQPK